MANKKRMHILFKDIWGIQKVEHMIGNETNLNKF